MRKLILATLFSLFWNAPLIAGERYAIGVDGLGCPFCAYGIEKKLTAIEGVDNIQTDIKEGRVIVTMRDGQSLTEPVAREAVKAAGFTLRSFAKQPGSD